MGSRAFLGAGPDLRNEIPKHVRSCFESVEARLKAHQFYWVFDVDKCNYRPFFSCCRSCFTLWKHFGQLVLFLAESERCKM